MRSLSFGDFYLLYKRQSKRGGRYNTNLFLQQAKAPHHRFRHWQSAHLRHPFNVPSSASRTLLQVCFIWRQIMFPAGRKSVNSYFHFQLVTVEQTLFVAMWLLLLSEVFAGVSLWKTSEALIRVEEFRFSFSQLFEIFEQVADALFFERVSLLAWHKGLLTAQPLAWCCSQTWCWSLSQGSAVSYAGTRCFGGSVAFLPLISREWCCFIKGLKRMSSSWVLYLQTKQSQTVTTKHYKSKQPANKQKTTNRRETKQKTTKQTKPNTTTTKQAEHKTWQDL